ncbi:fumarylacetoacetate hydrolase family protein [Maritimibacter sp. DP1N21-5]|uniref:fumarylacetoacetate hydrolase family protein n=1 Tax=Maritimibacter sp. DP1N21-5 TaxID=2836867 RepID=UPI001C494934|nr:fumarylacetoacetate hydrolase family protein [Maritimibacter sp. DP1N21-5]MBV7410632.1 fumarylacetoacetate hydrolase family protein [Maritimibacter sp. DP1N21-5]
MTRYLFPPASLVSVPMIGSDLRYPVTRIFCVGRNYAAHAAEMGVEVDREAPFYFTKTPAHLVGSGAVLPFPPGTGKLHHEMELAFVIGSPVFRAGQAEARAAIHAYACALDMTRRDLQDMAKEKRRPWDTGKDFEGSLVIAPLTPAAAFAPEAQRIHLAVNGATRQDASLGDMIHDCADIVAHLSTLYHLAPGDLILTGTPEGVGPVVQGDRIEGGIDGLAGVTLTYGVPE